MGMQVGKGVKVEQAEKALAKAGSLVDGESVWFYAKCYANSSNHFWSLIDAVVVTNARIMGLSTTPRGTSTRPLLHRSQRPGTTRRRAPSR
jgi:hypothetical protein